MKNRRPPAGGPFRLPLPVSITHGRGFSQESLLISLAGRIYNHRAGIENKEEDTAPVRGMEENMKKLLVQGSCQTLILMISLFLFSASVLHFAATGMQELKETEPETFAALEAIQLTVQSLPGAGNGAENAGTEPEKATVRITAEPADGSDSLQQRILRLMTERPDIFGMIYAGLFGLLIAAMIPGVLPWEKCAKKKRLLYRIDAAAYLGCGIPFLFLGVTGISILIMNLVYSLRLIVKMGIRLKEKHRIRDITPALMLFILIAVQFSVFPTSPYIVLVLISLISLKEILKLSFLQIRLDVLRKVIRKSYAAEILFGMLLLMIAFSILLCTMDDNFRSFEDALWFCFATVTTIGYGDVTTNAPIGRILGVVLGVYGIVVVALITSVIVNFYNETKAAPEEALKEERENLPPPETAAD